MTDGGSELLTPRVDKIQTHVVAAPNLVSICRQGSWKLSVLPVATISICFAVTCEMLIHS